MKRHFHFYANYETKTFSANPDYNVAPECPCWICNLIYSNKKDDNTRIMRSAAKRCDNFNYYHDEYHKLIHEEDAETFLEFLRTMGLKVDSYIKKRYDRKPKILPTVEDIKREEREKALLEAEKKKRFEKAKKETEKMLERWKKKGKKKVKHKKKV